LAKGLSEKPFFFSLRLGGEGAPQTAYPVLIVFRQYCTGLTFPAGLKRKMSRLRTSKILLPNVPLVY